MCPHRGRHLNLGRSSGFVGYHIAISYDSGHHPRGIDCLDIVVQIDLDSFGEFRRVETLRWMEGFASPIGYGYTEY